MRALVVAVTNITVALAVAAAAGCGRANPRVKTVTRSGTSKRVTTFAYDKDGHPTNITDDGVVTATFTFAGTHLVTLLDGRGKSTFTYDGDRIASATVDAGDAAKVTYGDGDRVQTLGTETFAYDKDGNLASIKDTGAAATTTTFTFKDGQLAKVAVTATAGGSKIVDGNVTVDGGHVTRIDIDAAGGKSSEAYAYDDAGRVKHVDLKGFDASGFDSVDVAYDDGDVTDIDMTPSLFFPFSALWDLHGQSRTTFDQTQVPRLLGATW